MPKFMLSCEVTVSAFTSIEAPTLKQAIKEASDRVVVLGGICSGESEEESWIIEEADGLPENIAES